MPAALPLDAGRRERHVRLWALALALAAHALLLLALPGKPRPAQVAAPAAARTTTLWLMPVAERQLTSTLATAALAVTAAAALAVTAAAVDASEPPSTLAALPDIPPAPVARTIATPVAAPTPVPTPAPTPAPIAGVAPWPALAGFGGAGSGRWLRAPARSQHAPAPGAPPRDAPLPMQPVLEGMAPALAAVIVRRLLEQLAAIPDLPAAVAGRCLVSAEGDRLRCEHAVAEEALAPHAGNLGELLHALGRAEPRLPRPAIAYAGGRFTLAPG